MGIFTGYDMIYDGYNISRIAYVEKIYRDSMPTINNNIKKMGDLFKVLDTHLEPSNISVDLRLLENNRVDLEITRRKLMQHLIKKEPKKLVLRDSDLFDMAILQGSTPFQKWYDTGLIKLDFVNPLGLQYGEFKTIRTNGEKLFYSGGYKTYPIIKVTLKKDTNEIKIINNTNNEFLHFKRPMKAGQKVTFGEFDNTLNHRQSVRFNGYLEMNNLTFDSDFFNLEVGFNDIQIIGTDEIEISYWELFV